MKTILVIEDNLDASENTAEILETANYVVVTAATGKTGIQLAALCQPDLIISDITMPDLDGFEVLKAVRNSIFIKNTPFIFLTARTDSTNRQNGVSLGANAYVTKPFDGNHLLTAISKLI